MWQSGDFLGLHREGDSDAPIISGDPVLLTCRFGCDLIVDFVAAQLLADCSYLRLRWSEFVIKTHARTKGYDP
jgi:hypothetical protein